MKSGIEYRHLRHIATNILDNLHAFQFGANVQGRKFGNFRNCRVHLGRHYYWILEMRPTMDHAVPHCINIEGRIYGTSAPGHQRKQQMPDGLLARCDR